jgi:hypothetical protein
VRGDGLGDSGASGDLADDPPGAVPVQPLPVRSRNTGPSVRSPIARSIARAVRGASGMVTTLPPLCVTVQGPVSALQAEMLDVRAGGLRHRQPVQCEQGNQRVLGRRAEPGGDEQSAELVAVQRDCVGLVIHPRPPDVGCRGMLQEFLFEGVLVEPGDGAQPPGDGGARPALCFQVPGEAFDVGPADGEQGQ